MTEARTQETISADLAEEAKLTRQRDEARHQANEADLTAKLRAVQSRLYGEDA